MSEEFIENNSFKQLVNIFSSKSKQNNLIYSTKLDIAQNSSDENDSYVQNLLAAILIYLFRINNYQRYSLLFNAENHQGNFRDNLNVFQVNITNEMNFREVLFISDNLSLKTAEMVEFNPNDTKNFTIAVIFYKKDVNQIKKLFNYVDFIFAVNSDNKVLSLITKDKLKKEFIKIVFEHIKNTLKLMDLENLPINKYELITDQEKEKIRQWNHSKNAIQIEGNLYHHFGKVIRKFPHNTAIKHDGKQISYSDLNTISDIIAIHLRQILKIEHQSRVAIFFDRSITMITSIMAILKAGLIYIPIDTKYPSERINMILEDSNAKLILTDIHGMSRLRKITFRNPMMLIDADKVILENENLMGNGFSFSFNNSSPDDLAYIIYTSGSTGKPKGVQITHRNILNYFFWFKRIFDFSEKNIIDFSSSISFDISVPCTLIPLLSGATISICSEHTKLDPLSYINYLNKNKVTHVELATDYFSHLLDYPEEVEKLSDLKWVLLGVEAVIKKDVELWLKLRPNDYLANEYGPTECTVAVTAQIINKRNIHEFNEIIPIGKISDNNKAYIVDKYLSLCPIGVCGELCIAGSSVSKGYIDKEQNDKGFIQNPFNTEKENLYKTGDVVRWLPNGVLEFHGRKDTQIKICGHRIELQEIEKIILENKDVKQVKVLLHEDSEKKRFLVAYIIKHGDSSLNSNNVMKCLKKMLPYYMLPRSVIFLDKFPITNNDKIDQNALKNKYSQLCEKQYMEKQTMNEGKLNNFVTIFREVFNNHLINEKDDFFELGGNSLLAVRLVNRIESIFNVKIELYQLFEYSKISDLWNFIIDPQLITENTLSVYSDFFPKLINFTKNNNQIKLFLLPPVGGTVFIYKDLSRFLSRKFEVYGLQDILVYNPNRNYSSLEEMASYYLHVIRTVQPEGEYYLAGASFGATLAVEIARQLEIANNKVSFLGLFDGWPYYSDKLLNKNFFMRLMYDKLNYLTEEETNKFLESQFIKESLLFKYRIPHIKAPITLFKAKIIADIFKEFDDPCNNWDKVISNKIDVHVIPGDHESILLGSNVKLIASIIVSSIFSGEVIYA